MSPTTISFPRPAVPLRSPQRATVRIPSDLTLKQAIKHISLALQGIARSSTAAPPAGYHRVFYLESIRPGDAADPAPRFAYITGYTQREGKQAILDIL